MDTILPEENKDIVVASVEQSRSIENVIDIKKFSKYLKRIYVNARVISSSKHIPVPSLSNIIKFPSIEL